MRTLLPATALLTLLAVPAYAEECVVYKGPVTVFGQYSTPPVGFCP